MWTFNSLVEFLKLLQQSFTVMPYSIGDSYSCISFLARVREREGAGVERERNWLTPSLITESKDQVYAEDTIRQTPVLSENGFAVRGTATFIDLSIN